MENKRIYDRESDGISFYNRTFMIDGYIDDYSLVSTDEKSYLDLINNKGYVDDRGRIWIYQEIPSKKLGSIPWFTVDVKKGKNEYRFSNRGFKESDDAFRVENIGNCSYNKIVSSLKGSERLYDEKILNDLNAATSIFRPTIKEKDDFLKKILKYVILKKEVNIAKYISKFPKEKKYILSNMKQALTNDTKTSTVNFITWCELLGVDFTIVIKDNKTDSDPLKKNIIYESRTDSVHEEE